MGVVAYIDYEDEDNDAAIALIETDAGVGVNVTYRIPLAAQPADLDPLETVVYALDADTDIADWATAVGVTVLSIDDLP